MIKLKHGEMAIANKMVGKVMMMVKMMERTLTAMMGEMIGFIMT